MTIAYTGNSAHNNSGTASLAAAFGSNNTAGNFIFVIAGNISGSVTGISDTLGNSFTQLETNSTYTAWYVANCKGGANTITVTAASTAPFGIVAQEFSGVSTSSPLDQHATAVTGSLSATLTSNSITPSQNNELVVSYGWSDGAGQSITGGSGFTNFLESTSSSPANGAMQSQIQTTATAVTGSMTFTTSGGTGYVNIASFKAASTSSSHSGNRLLLGVG